MPRFEIFQVTTLEHHATAEAEGLAAHSDDACASCGEQVGLDGYRLYEYVVVTDEHDDFWFVCPGCALPVLDPEG